MTAPQMPTPEADSTSGDKSPSFSPSASESASKCRETTVACNGDALTAGDDNPCKTLALVSPAPAVTATDTESPEGGAEPDRLVEELRSHIPTRAPTAVSQRQAFPSFMRRYTDMAGSRGPEIYRWTKPNASNLPLSTAGWQREIVTSDGRSG